MRSVGAERPEGVADGSPAPEGGQAVRGAALAALALWSLTALLGGGMDLGTGRGGAGALGALVAAGLVPAAAMALWATRRDMLAGAPARLALAAATALAVWTALSVLWAAEPALAWLAGVRQAVALAALVLGLAAAAALPRAADRLPLAVSVAAAPALALALATVALPGVLGEDGARARLDGPVGYPNALALLAAVALPGVLLAGAGPSGSRPRTAAAAAAGTAALVVVCVLTLSRGGVAAAAVAALLTVALMPRPRRGLAVLGAGLAGAVPPLAWGLTASGLTEDGLTTAARARDGAVFGVLLLAGLALAAALAGPAARGLGGGPEHRLRRMALIAASLAALTPAVAVAAGAADIADCGRAALGDDRDRLVQLSSNQRGAWWCEAGRAWRDAPAVGHGAGSFPVVQRRFREDAADALLTRDPHQVWLSTMAALGLVGLAFTLLLWGAVAWAALRRRAALAAGPAAIVAAGFVQAQTDWVLAWPVVAVPVAAAAGLLLRAGAATAASPRTAGRGDPALAAALAALALAVPVAAALPFLAQRAVQDGRDALAAGDLRAARDAAARARTLNPVSLDPLFLRARVLTVAGDPRGAREALRRATEVQPDNPASWRRLALALGDEGGARRAWIRVHLLDPYAADARAALGIPALGDVPPDAAAAGPFVRPGGR